MPATIQLGPPPSTGSDVTKWQGLLTSAGYPTPVTGTFDAATDANTRAWQQVKGLTVDGIVGPASWGAMTGVAQAGKTDPRAKEAREVLLTVWPKILEEAAASKYPEVRALGAQGMPNLSELQIAMAMGKLESNYGHSGYKNNVTGETSGTIWNWGAVQAGKPPCGPDAFETSDTGPEGTYNYCYKKYPDSEAGALDFLRLLTIRRPASWALMKTGDLDAYSVQMHSWTPPLTQLGVGHGSSVLNKDPITGMFGYFEQPPLTANGRAAGLARRAADIAFTLNEPLMVKRGGPVPPGGIETPPEEGGIIPYISEIAENPAVRAGALAALLAGAATIAWRVWKGRWPWPF